MGGWIEVPRPGGPMPAWLERPAREPAGAVLLLHEIFGANRAMRAAASWIAATGHIALVPDLYWRQAPGTALDPDRGMREWERAFGLMRGFDEAAAVEDLGAVLALARGLPGCNGRVATLGFCLGGRLAVRMAIGSEAVANVAYYGVGIEALLEPRPALRAPLLLHLAGRDRFVPPEAQRRIITAMEGMAGVEVVVHPAADHAFARIGARGFDARAAAVAGARTETVLARALG
jgi:carboxymethylenebutenolidase